ncbi:hypothetical protein COU59_03290 [Candidatus Pacearchaeota archaeon CG10_big_fil_rev_8_21_14_0_10_34_12]|nr:MAG: hypothetical protein COU59_03290 [Candidatus Pacearchaeota archaeon CG10_big_fil_rev_8_21_14_0_10_34_12]
MKKLIPLLFLFLVLITSLNFISAHENHENTEVQIYLFHGQGCPHCAVLISFLDEIKEDYNLNIHEYEIYFNQTNRKIFEQFTEAFGTEIQGVPTLFIDNQVFVGYNSQIGQQIKDTINFCSENLCEDPLNNVADLETTTTTGDSSPLKEPGKTELKKRLTIPAVISAAIVDAINPCAFAVLVILLTTILLNHNRKKALFAGLAFSTAIFISYFLMGLGLYTAVQATGITKTFFLIVAVLAILLGLFNLKDYFFYGKWFIMEVPLSWRPKMKSLIKSVTSIPGAFLIGFLVSLFLLPCTSGPYIIILGLLAETATKNYAIILLFLYNVIFIIPMIVITFLVYYGITTTEKMELWRQSKLKFLHLIAGIILILLGIGMILAIRFGII